MRPKKNLPHNTSFWYHHKLLFSLLCRGSAGHWTTFITSIINATEKSKKLINYHHHFWTLSQFTFSLCLSLWWLTPYKKSQSHFYLVSFAPEMPLRRKRKSQQDYKTTRIESKNIALSKTCASNQKTTATKWTPRERRKGRNKRRLRSSPPRILPLSQCF